MNSEIAVEFKIDLSHRPVMSLAEYYVLCAKCPFKDMKKECVRAQSLRNMACYGKELPKDL